MHSTITSLTEFLDYVTNALNNKESALVLFIDVSKAFDSINHDTLFRKLEVYGFRSVTLQWFKDYLSNRFQYMESKLVVSQFKLIKF
jgi:hypothetical protein